MSQSWALEFVGGPYDGRHDIVTPVEWYVFQCHAREPIQYVIAAGNEIPDSFLEPRIHVYKRGLMRKQCRRGNVLNRIEWEVWLHDCSS